MLIQLTNKIRKDIPREWDLKLRPLWFLIQRLERGFDESEIWSLDSTIAQFALPRLKYYRERVPHIQVKDQEYLDKIDEIIWLFEQYESEKFYSLDKEERERAYKAAKLFGKYFMGLWL